MVLSIGRGDVRFVLIRHLDTGKQTLGSMLGYMDYREVFRCRTLELAWKQNARKISCIPPGRYHCKARVSEGKGHHFLIENVEGRDWILFHIGNFAAGERVDTEGCVLAGNDFGDLNKDNNLDLIGSTYAMKRLLEVGGDGFTVDIVGV